MIYSFPRRQILWLVYFFLTNICRQDIFKSFHIRPLPLLPFNPLQFFIPLMCLSIHLLVGEVLGFRSDVCQPLRYKGISTSPLGLPAGPGVITAPVMRYFLLLCRLTPSVGVEMAVAVLASRVSVYTLKRRQSSSLSTPLPCDQIP